MSRNPFDQTERGGCGRGHVLLVLRDLGTATELVLVLEREGYLASWVPCAEEALAVTRHMRPDLIVVGAQLPEMDGASLCDRLGSRPELDDVPFVVMPEEEPPTRHRYERFLHQIDCACAA